MKTTRSAVFLALALAVTACGGASKTGALRVREAERARQGVASQDTPTLAPQAFAEAEQALKLAKEAEKNGDNLAAELHAERAIAAYQHAIAQARLARATAQEAQAKDALAQAVEQGARYSAARKAAEREADDLEKQLKVAKEADRPGASGTTTDPEREKARLVAAQALVTQARLLCSAARLVSPQAPGLAEAEAATADLEKKLESSPKPAPIDAAGKARAACLSALTKARRSTAAAEPDQADALLGELSRARLDAKADLLPTRDERGVVVTLRSLFTPKAEKLSTEGASTLKDLGRIASAHPGFAVQVVVHDADAKVDSALNQKRGDAVLKALSEGGASPAKTKVEQAGAHQPVFDPADAQRRAKNERIEIVFVN